MVLISQNLNRINYIQQYDEFDYLKNFIKSFDKGTCMGILLHGPPGTGKTLLAITLANSFKAHYYIIDGSPDLDRRDIEGYWEIFNGETQFNYGPLTKAIEDANKEGISFIIINEVNAIRESEQISLNSLLSENHVNLISKGFERYELNPKSKLVIIGTLNKGVIGINKLQEAFEDRFIVSPEINYPIKQKEIEIATIISGCDKNIAELVVDVARQIRKQALKDFSITKIFSTRLIVNFCIVISSMSPKFLRHNIENIIINKLGENQEEKKSIAMILDGKMFEEKLNKLLRSDGKSNVSQEVEIDLTEEEENKNIIAMKKHVDKYIQFYGSTSVFKKDGNIMWKFIEWFWCYNRKILRDYIQLTRKIGLHNLYSKTTRKNYLYNGEITLSYIRWLYQNKKQELMNFMNIECPIFNKI
ncbi:MAG: AAA family ATPase [Candidatus Lokiarchaeota archaeon]|nr:AAA family ATPase [Candidatus Lokiarchaeota archaeon]